ncbi:MAG: nucleotide exchange factor GrpE [Variibacter sp.]
MTDPNARASSHAGEAANTENPKEATPREAEGPANVADAAAAAAKEAAEYRDRWMRGLAEMENLRRRTEREINDARTYGIAAFARDILAVADNMDRATQALDAEIRANADAEVKALLDGVELTERELLKVLEKHGVKKLDPMGEKFDPNLHQAMFEVPDPSVPPGMVSQVVQAGYTIGDRVLRPALVGVSKGGVKGRPQGASGATAAEAPANDNSD